MKQYSDRVVFDFGHEFPPIILYNNASFADMINKRGRKLLEECLGHLRRAQRREVVKKYDFLVEAGVRCVPLTRKDVRIGFSLLDAFVRNHNLKRDFRNSWNDLLILAAVINAGSVLVTRDNELSRFGANQNRAEIRRTPPFVELEFPAPSARAERLRLESKGYSDRGWRVRFSGARSHVS